jgi:hypothetical protein
VSTRNCASRAAIERPRLAAADHENYGISIGIFVCGLALVEPVRAAEVARVSLPPRPGPPKLFLKALQFIERSQQRPSLQPAVVSIRDETYDAAAAADRGFKFEYRFDTADARSRDVSRRCAFGVDLKPARLGRARAMRQLLQNGFDARSGLQVPRESQNIAPEALGAKQVLQRAIVFFRQRGFKLHKPVRRP